MSELKKELVVEAIKTFEGQDPKELEVPVLTEGLRASSTWNMMQTWLLLRMMDGNISPVAILAVATEVAASIGYKVAIYQQEQELRDPANKDIDRDFD